MPIQDLTVEDWFDELERAMKYRQIYGCDAAWGRLEQMFYNTHQSSANVASNLIMSIGDAILSGMTVPTPYVMISPLRPENVQSAPILENLDNSLRRQLKIQDAFEVASFNAYLMGRGIVKIGYDSEFGWDPSLDIMGTERLGMSLTQLNRAGHRIEYNGLVQPGMPWVSEVDPRDFLVPWGTREIHDAWYVCHRLVRHIDDVKADPKYSNTKELNPTLSMEDFIHSYQTSQSPRKPTVTRVRKNSFTGKEAPEFVELFEIHDRRTRMVKVIAAGHDEFLRDDESALMLDGRLPFVSFSFVPRGRTFWVTSDASYVEHAQLELADIAITSQKQRRASVLKWLYRRGAIDYEELQKAFSSEVGIGVAVNDGFDLNAVVAPLQHSPNSAIYQDDQYVRNNAREQTGLSSNQFGVFAGRRTSASEAMLVDKSSSLRTSRKGVKLKRAYEQTFQVINSYIFNFWTTPQLTQILGPQGAEEWVQFTGGQLRGLYDYEVVLGDQDGLAGRRANAMQLFMGLSQDPSVDQVALRQTMTRAFNDPNFATLYRDVEQLQALQGQPSPAQLAANGQQGGQMSAAQGV